MFWGRSTWLKGVCVCVPLLKSQHALVYNKTGPSDVCILKSCDWVTGECDTANVTVAGPENRREQGR